MIMLLEEALLAPGTLHCTAHSAAGTYKYTYHSRYAARTIVPVSSAFKSAASECARHIQ